MVLHSWLDGFVRVTGKSAPRRHFLTEVSISLVSKAQTAFAWHFVAFHFVRTALSVALDASSLGTLAVWRGLCFH